jgi:hypothetical protein
MVVVYVRCLCACLVLVRRERDPEMLHKTEEVVVHHHTRQRGGLCIYLESEGSQSEA